jgi:hypothetical protein
LDNKKPKEKMEELLTDPSKKSFSTAHHLLRIWREFLAAEQVTPSKWTRLVGEHISKLRQIKSMDAQQIGTARGNLVKSFIEKPSMSFQALVRGMEFLGYKAIRIQITGIRPDGTEITNAATISLQKRRMLGESPEKEGSSTSDPSIDDAEED